MNLGDKKQSIKSNVKDFISNEKELYEELLFGNEDIVEEKVVKKIRK